MRLRPPAAFHERGDKKKKFGVDCRTDDGRGTLFRLATGLVLMRRAGSPERGVELLAVQIFQGRRLVIDNGVEDDRLD